MSFKKIMKIIGFKNFGNTCYINTILNCIFHYEKIANIIFNENAAFLLNINDTDNIQLQIFKSVIEFFNAFYHNWQLDHILCNLVNLLFKTNLLVKNEQEDAYYFFQMLITTIEQTLINALSLTSIASMNIDLSQIIEFFTQQLGYVQLNQTITCSNGHASSSQIKEILSLSIHNCENIYESLDLYFSPVNHNILNANRYLCSTCDALVDAINIKAIARTPNILVIQLKLFAFVNNQSVSISNSISRNNFL